MARVRTAALLACTTAYLGLVASAGAMQVAAHPEPTGGAGLGGPAPHSANPPRVPAPPSRHGHGVWMHGFTITEYWPAPEAWFVGAPVSAPGLTGKHRVDWLYSAGGVSMQGEGLGLDGQMYHLAAAGTGGWVTSAGKPTTASNGWAAGPPFWRSGGFWQSVTRAVTFPLAACGWYAGAGKGYVPLRGIRFATGPSLALRFYQSIAVDPRVIPLGSRVYIPAYRHDGHGGWFIAQDTGGAVLGHHVDVYRTPPPGPQDAGRKLSAQRVYVIRPRGHSSA